MTEQTRCIMCKHFTLRPRTRTGSNEPLREQDRQYSKTGLGRCAHTQESYRWHSAECPRECAKAVPIDADQVQARRAYIANIALVST
ncbi:hypothetical protein GTP45_27415 [Pseudoduganella sp. FT55W]|uniref:Uncharacterized protein n=1 Tax=Duganella rivi TaxID=2666083 RepID=A0A7X4GVS5_9BURK|nr:hypothetical protein [Duganella rivi]MYM70511.1 hypothetical protein [Duganella rivi]